MSGAERRRRLSFLTLGTPGRRLEELIELALRFGFDGVDLRYSDRRGELAPQMTGEQIAQVGRQLADAGLKIPTFLCYWCPDPDAAGWPDRYRAELGELLEVARLCGAGYARVFGPPRLDQASPARSEARLRACAEVIRGALEQGPGGVGVVMQNHAGTSGALECAALARLIANRAFGIAYAPDHVVAHEPESLDAQLGEVVTWVRVVYLSDLRALGGEPGARAFRPALPGSGCVPLLEPVSALERAGFTGFISLKWEKLWHAELPEIEEAIPRFLELFRS